MSGCVDTHLIQQFREKAKVHGAPDDRAAAWIAPYAGNGIFGFYRQAEKCLSAFINLKLEERQLVDEDEPAGDGDAPAKPKKDGEEDEDTDAKKGDAKDGPASEADAQAVATMWERAFTPRAATSTTSEAAAADPWQAAFARARGAAA